MDAWFLRGYLVFAVVMVLIAAAVAVRVDLLPKDERLAAEDALQPTSVVVTAPTTVQSTAIPTSTVAAVDLDACAATPQLMTPPAGSAWVQTFPIWFGEASQPLAVAPFVWSQGNPALPDTGVYWFAGGAFPVLWHGARETLLMSATPVDGTPSERVEFEPSEFHNEVTQAVTVDFPAPGCWDVTATAGDTEATLRVAVAPLQQRPDYLYAAAGNAAQPYAVPADCAVSVWSGPALQSRLGTVLWGIETPSVTMTHRTGVLWAEGAGTVYLLPEDGVTLLGVNGRALDGSGSARLPADTRLRPIGDGIGASVSLTFPTAGCWEVTPVSASGSLEPVTLYVYPADCRRESDAEPVPEGCRAP